MRYDLQPESEDGFSRQPEVGSQDDPLIAWIALPRVSNTSDAHPWTLDSGIRMQWTRSKGRSSARTHYCDSQLKKNTIDDLHWLRKHGLDTIIRERAAAGVPIVGICAGYQMLGQVITDPEGIAGSAGSIEGIGLLPVKTSYAPEKMHTTSHRKVAKCRMDGLRNPHGPHRVYRASHTAVAKRCTRRRHSPTERMGQLLARPV